MDNETARKRDMLLKYKLNLLPPAALKTWYRQFYPQGSLNKSREEVIAAILRSLCFEDQSRFDEWFGALTRLEKTLARKLVFHAALPAALLERETGEPVVLAEKGRFKTVFTLNPAIKLRFLQIFVRHGIPVVAMPDISRIAFKPFLPPPAYGETAKPPGTAAPGGSALDADGKTFVLNYETRCAEMFSLLDEALAARQKKDPARDPLALSPKTIRALYAESGFTPFPDCGFDMPDRLSLAASFILCQNTQAEDKRGGQWMRGMVSRFFSPEPPAPQERPYRAGSYFEGLLAARYLKRRAAPGFENDPEYPPSRTLFLGFLRSIAERTSAVPLNEAFAFLLAGDDFVFSRADISRFFYFPASSLTVDGVTYRAEKDEITPDCALAFELLTKPLFKAYCFLFCALGCLEITVSPPESGAVYRGKETALSPYDGVSSVKVTGWGKWLLGFSPHEPEPERQLYEVRADDTLLMVTLRGESIERRVFLDKIGVKIGEERWTVSPASFTGGCATPQEVAERIAKFRALIDASPAARWETFFAQTAKNAASLTDRTGDFLVYQTDFSPETRAALARDPEFRQAACFAGESLLLVAKSGHEKCRAILAGYGILPTARRQDGSAG